MNSVRYCLDRKGYHIWSIHPNAFVFDALRLMSEKEIGALAVIDEGKLVGIFSERDYARKIILQGKSSKKTRVGEIMTERVICIGPDQGIEDCMVLMTEYRVRHLPVLEDGELVGIISIGDAVKEIINEQKFVIEQLENYIMGKR
jgi:CBS domain-containing protein